MISLVFVGAPGSGKGTLAQKFVNDFKFLHLSTGDMFRSISKEDTPLAKQITKLMIAGEYIPDDLTNQMVKVKLDDCLKNKSSFILDGYPRNLLQAQFLNNVCDVDCVVNLKVNDEQLIIDRILNRLVCRVCQRTYNKRFSPPKKPFVCDVDGGELYHRSDDDGEIIRKRIQLYIKSVLPIIDYYNEQKKVFNIDAELNIEENYVKLLTHLGISKSDDHN